MNTSTHLESLPSLGRECVVVDLCVEHEREPVLLAEHDARLDRVRVVLHHRLEGKVEQRLVERDLQNIHLRLALPVRETTVVFHCTH